VVTLDNRQAKIQQGVAVRFDASDGDSVSTSFIDAVLELAVTPHITADRAIIMKIKVSRNAPQLNDTGSEVVGIAKNETQTEALVRDGQTMVLGGIYTVDKGASQDKIPFLADIPIVGVAFRNSSKQDVRRELLIFVTPRVVQGEAPAS
jgi:type IV pilus assembly protein PilQ